MSGNDFQHHTCPSIFFIKILYGFPNKQNEVPHGFHQIDISVIQIAQHMRFATLPVISSTILEIRVWPWFHSLKPTTNLFKEHECRATPHFESKLLHCRNLDLGLWQQLCQWSWTRRRVHLLQTVWMKIPLRIWQWFYNQSINQLEDTGNIWFYKRICKVSTERISHLFKKAYSLSNNNHISPSKKKERKWHRFHLEQAGITGVDSMLPSVIKEQLRALTLFHWLIYLTILLSFRQRYTVLRHCIHCISNFWNL